MQAIYLDSRELRQSLKSEPGEEHAEVAGMLGPPRGWVGRQMDRLLQDRLKCFANRCRSGLCLALGCKSKPGATVLCDFSVHSILRGAHGFQDSLANQSLQVDLPIRKGGVFFRVP